MLNETELQQDTCIEQIETALEKAKNIKGNILSVCILLMEKRGGNTVLTKIGAGFQDSVVESLISALSGGFDAHRR